MVPYDLSRPSVSSVRSRAATSRRSATPSLYRGLDSDFPAAPQTHYHHHLLTTIHAIRMKPRTFDCDGSRIAESIAQRSCLRYGGNLRRHNGFKVHLKVRTRRTAFRLQPKRASVHQEINHCPMQVQRSNTAVDDAQKHRTARRQKLVSKPAPSETTCARSAPAAVMNWRRSLLTAATRE
jgi:hypothetical protein